jgi:hypothetical protein
MKININFSLPRAASFLIGISLIAASLLKARQWLYEPQVASEFLPIVSLRVAIVDFELALGFWLISGLLPRIAWSIAIVTFSVFLTITTRDVFVGKTSCSCFGSVITPPLLVSIFDLAVIVCLVRLFPRVLSRSRVVIFLSVFLFFLTSAASTTALLNRDNHPKLHFTPESIDLGPTQAGASYRRAFILSNDGIEDIDIASVETSCHCLSVYLSTNKIPLGKKIDGEMIFIPEINVESQNLSITIKFFDIKNNLLAVMTVNTSK